MSNITWQKYYDEAVQDIKEIAKHLIDEDKPGGASEFLNMLDTLEDSYRAWRMTLEEIRGEVPHEHN